MDEFENVMTTLKILIIGESFVGKSRYVPIQNYQLFISNYKFPFLIAFLLPILRIPFRTMLERRLVLILKRKKSKLTEIYSI